MDLLKAVQETIVEHRKAIRTTYENELKSIVGKEIAVILAPYVDAIVNTTGQMPDVIQLQVADVYNDEFDVKQIEFMTLWDAEGKEIDLYEVEITRTSKYSNNEYQEELAYYLSEVFANSFDVHEVESFLQGKIQIDQEVLKIARG